MAKIVNDKYLNKKVVYRLPYNTRLCLYCVNSSIIRGIKFKEDISINAKYDFRVLEEKHPTDYQVLVRSEDSELLKYLRGYDFNKLKRNTISNFQVLRVGEVEEIIKDYYKNRGYIIDG